MFQVQAPWGLYLVGRFNGGFLRYRFGGIWRGLFSEFYVFFLKNSFLAILMLISRKLVQRRGIGEKCAFFATRRPSPKGLRESGTPSPPLSFRRKMFVLRPT